MRAALIREHAEVVVVGYGNPLRSDDAVGLCVAAEVARRHRPGVVALAVPQLVPELSASIATARLVVFVDARRGAVEGAIAVDRIEPSETDPFSAHASSPRALLSMTRALFDATPEAWLISVPAVNFKFGDQLSPTARRGVDAALVAVETLADVATRAPALTGL